MRRRSYILGILAVAFAATAFACSLNPQPFPPASLNGDPDGGVAADAGFPAADSSVSDAGAGPDTGPPVPDAGVDSGDAGSDAATDAGDGGDAGPSDAALVEGG